MNGNGSSTSSSVDAGAEIGSGGLANGHESENGSAGVNGGAGKVGDDRDDDYANESYGTGGEVGPNDSAAANGELDAMEIDLDMGTVDAELGSPSQLDSRIGELSMQPITPGGNMGPPIMPASKRSNRKGKSSNKKGGRKDGKRKDRRDKGSMSALKPGSSKKRSEDEDPNKNEDDHPFRIGALLEVRYTDGQPKLAVIIERTEVQSEASNPDPARRWRYYVHYNGMNRRMDSWVDCDKIISPPSIAATKEREEKEAQERERKEAELRSLQEEAETDPGMRTRRQKRRVGEDDDEFLAMAQPGNEGHHDEHEGLDEASLKEHEEVTKVKNVNEVELGKYVMECWYFSPFPKEYFPDGYADRLYFCEYSLAFFRHKSELIRWHQSAKPPPHPPGNEIYRSGSLAMFEVDGAEQTFYCQNLCYLAKLFLDHKTLYYDVDPFLFYILCEVDERGFHIVGYFSKEKYSDLGYNLACILIFPAHQRKGYGRFLISFSYELSKKEEKVGSPEKPLSDLGAVSYRSYWASVILACLSTWKEESISIMDVSKATSIMSDDVSNTLQFLGLLRYKGGQHVIVADKEQLKLLRIKYPIKEPAVDAGRLHWAPLITDQKKDKFHIRSKRAPEAEPDDGG